MRSLVICLCCLVCASCGTFPELDAAISDKARAADYPSLVPEAQITAKRVEGRLSETDGEMLLRRAEQLRRRGNILRNIPLINDAARRDHAPELRALGG